VLGKTGFDGMLERWRLERLFRHGEADYIGIKAGGDGLTVKFRQGNVITLDPKPFVGKYFPNFNLGDPKIEWHQCPDNLVEGIAYIEGIRAKELKINKKIRSSAFMWREIMLDGTTVIAVRI
jgi:hypothetical protein